MTVASGLGFSPPAVVPRGHLIAADRRPPHSDAGAVQVQRDLAGTGHRGRPGRRPGHGGGRDRVGRRRGRSAAHRVRRRNGEGVAVTVFQAAHDDRAGRSR